MSLPVTKVAKIGQGAFGEVYQVTDAYGASYAMKRITNYGNNWQNEVNILMRLNHVNVIKIYNFFSDSNVVIQNNVAINLPYINIVMDLCACNLNQLLVAKPGYYGHELRFMCEMAAGLSYLHCMEIAHRDLKLENVLVKYENGQPTVKIADFGISKMLGLIDAQEAQQLQYMASIIGTDMHMAPEVYDAHYTLASDVFALAVIYLAILERRTIVLGGKNILVALFGNECIGKVLHDIPLLKRELGHTANNLVNGSIPSLINSMLLRDYHQRPSAMDVHIELWTVQLQLLRILSAPVQFVNSGVVLQPLSTQAVPVLIV